MGICLSTVASSDTQRVKDGHENAIFYEDRNYSDEILKLGSVYSKEGSKALNQDAAILYQEYGDEEGVFCGVFDGHGKSGHLVSEMVRNRLPLLLLGQKNSITKPNGDEVNYIDLQNSFERIISESEPTHNFHKWKEALITAFKVMDKEIQLLEYLDCSCSGTTAVVALKQGDDLITANLGDSRAVLGTITENGIKTIQLTTDLKPSLPMTKNLMWSWYLPHINAGEASRIIKCNGRIIALNQEPHIQRVWLPHEDFPGLAMSRAFGDFILKDYGIIAIPDISYRRLTSKDQFIVLATDGVWDVLSNNEVASIVWKAESEQVAAKAVVEMASATWKKKFLNAKVDDCTVVCLFLHKKQQNLGPVKS